MLRDNLLSLIFSLIVAFWLSLSWRCTSAYAEPIEILVTADAVEQDLTHSLTSTSQFTSETLEESNSQHIDNISDAIPNLTWAGGTNRARFFQIRGVGELEQYEGSPNPSVAFLIDDFDLSGMGAVGTLFDLDKITVARGPQGFGFGPSGLAGLIQLKTKDPTPYFSANAEAGIGSDGLWTAGAAMSGPLSKESTNFQYRLSASQTYSNGFRNNDFLSSDSTNQRNEALARAKLRWSPSTITAIDFQVMHLEANNGYDAFAVDNGFTTQSDQPGTDDQRTQGAALKLSFDLAPRSSLIATSTIMRSSTDYSYDGDWGNNQLWGSYAPYDYFSRTQRTRHTATHELRLLSTPHASRLGQEWNWLAGLYQQRLTESSAETQFQDKFAYDDLASDFGSRINAAFGALEVPVVAGTAFTLGLRGEDRTSDYKDSRTIASSAHEALFGFLAGIKQQLSDLTTVSLLASRGYKGGGVNTGLAIPSDKLNYGAEKIYNFEASVDTALLDQSLQVKLTAFHSLRRDQQVKYALQSDPQDPLAFTYLTDNAARGHNQGLEFEAKWNLARRLTLFSNAALLNTRFDKYPSGARDLKGRAQAYAPRWQHDTGLRYQLSDSWFVRTDLSGRDAFYFDDSHDQKSGSYHLLNASFGYQGKRWSWVVWAHNILDRRYAVRGFYFGLEPPDFPTKEYIQLGDPRQIGMTLRVEL
ncbi:MAG: TonB-dependent receptor plug domain-containing protein [Oligoflexia bacterium]|nr:TonB-dependent receptor plug domain-containing protein [Oligoflexia bacterium]